MEIISRKMHFWALPSMYLFERYSWFVERYNPRPYVSTLLTQLKQLYAAIAAPHDHQQGLWRLLWCEENCQAGCCLAPEGWKEGSLSLQPLVLCCWLPNPPASLRALPAAPVSGCHKVLLSPAPWTGPGSDRPFPPESGMGKVCWSAVYCC